MVIEGPGEYEIGDTYIKGVATKGIDDTINTVYVVKVDDMTLCHLGALAGDLNAETKEAIGDVDILFVPTYGGDVLPPAVAQKISAGLSSKLIVPLFYGAEDRDSLKKFLKEAGEEKGEVVEKLTIKKKELEGKEGELSIIKSF